MGGAERSWQPVSAAAAETCGGETTSRDVEMSWEQQMGKSARGNTELEGKQVEP